MKNAHKRNGIFFLPEFKEIIGRLMDNENELKEIINRKVSTVKETDKRDKAGAATPNPTPMNSRIKPVVKTETPLCHISEIPHNAPCGQNDPTHNERKR